MSKSLKNNRHWGFDEDFEYEDNINDRKKEDYERRKIRRKEYDPEEQIDPPHIPSIPEKKGRYR